MDKNKGEASTSLWSKCQSLFQPLTFYFPAHSAATIRLLHWESSGGNSIEQHLEEVQISAMPMVKEVVVVMMTTTVILMRVMMMFGIQ